MSESSSSRPESPAGPPKRIVSGSLKDRIAKFNNPGSAPPPLPNHNDGTHPHGSASYARGGLIGNRLPSLNPKSAGIVGSPGFRRVSEGKGIIGNRIPSSGASASSVGSAPGSAAGSKATGASGRSVRSASPAGSATSSVASASASAASGTLDSASVGTSLSSSPATSPGGFMPPQLLVSTLPDGHEPGTMTPSSTRAEAGEEASSMPSTPVPTASSELPPPDYDLVPGNLKLAAGYAKTGDARSVSSAMSISSSLVSQYDPASEEGREEGERPTNLKDVSEVSTPTGTPRQALRQLDGDSVAGSSRGNPSAPPSDTGDVADLHEKLDTLNVGKGSVDDEADTSKTTAGTLPTSGAEKAEDAVTPSSKDGTATSHLDAEDPTPLESQITPTPTADNSPPQLGKDTEEKDEVSEEPSVETAQPSESQSEALEAVADRADGAREELKAGPDDTSEKPVEKAAVDMEVVKEDKPDSPSEEEDRDTTPEAPKVAISPAPGDEEAVGSLEAVGRRSEDTIMPSASIGNLSTSASQDALSTPLATPKDKDSSDTPSVIDLSASPRLHTTDRDSTPVPRGSSKSQSILDENSDIVSMIAAPSGRPFSDDLSQGQLDNFEDEMSNRSSMPPARASSELEFRYEDLHERFAGDGVKSSNASSTHTKTNSTHSFTPAAAGGAALAAAAATSDFRGSSSKAQQSNHSTGDVASSAINEDRFPSVPVTDLNAKSPMQVHIEPSPFGPISDDDIPEEKTEEPKPARPESGTLGSGFGAPVLKFETVKEPSSTPDRRTPDFPDAPNNTLPNTPGATTPVRSPTPSAREASTSSTISPKAFPKVPDEEHPYVGVHISPQTKGALNPKTPFPSAPDGGTPRSESTSARTPSQQGSPSKAASSEGSHRSLGVEPRGPKRLSYSPRPPELDDEDPGDFEGGGWAVVTKWEPWRGSPPGDRPSRENSLGPDVPPPVPPKD